MDHFSRCIALEEAAVPNGAKVCSLAPGVIATDMPLQLRSADPAHFPDLPTFQALHAGGQLSSPPDAARRVLAYLNSPLFGQDAVGDVRG
jgi:NAD(P)-dependent dehydrogenase (short-subunit alcohol dehydrogenase family)